MTLGSWLVDLEIGFERVLAASVSVGLLAVLFGAVALAGGALRPGRTRAIAIAAGLAVASWVFDGPAQAVDVLEPWRRLGPYYDALGQNPLLRGESPWGGWALLAAGDHDPRRRAPRSGLERRDVRQ